MKKILKKILLLNKKEGETPLEALDKFRRENKKYQNVKMTYAGRLDPMASGLLLVLADEEVKNKEKYLTLNKEYEFEILFGFATDTYDILGKVTKAVAKQDLTTKEFEKKIKENLKYFTGTFMQKYPMYSSKTLAGKPLFMYARALNKVESPEHEVDVQSLKFIKLRKINNVKLLEDIKRRVAKVNEPARNAKSIPASNASRSDAGWAFAGGDFRQKEIIKIWQVKLQKSQGRFFVGSFHIKCGSGTYVRSIANDLGDMMHIPALAFSIKRTKIGKWSKIG